MKLPSISSSKVLALASLASFSLANKAKIDDSYTQSCTGMYNKQAWGGSTNPFISFNLQDYKSDIITEPQVSVVIFEYKDIDIIGHELSDGNMKYICDDASIELGYCEKSSKGEFIIDQDKLGKNASEILTFDTTELGIHQTKYSIKNTGYYCVATFAKAEDAKYRAEANFRNSFGQIAASEFPKLTLYGALAIAYAVSMAYYGFNFWKHKHEILPLQKYFLFFFLFLTIETVFVWGFYDLENRKGESDAGVKVYLSFTSILSGFKVSFSFFLLLVISLGYGVVYPKLDRKLMFRCQIFTAVHLVFVVFYIVTNYLSSPETQSLLAGIPAIPVAITTAVFYALVLSSLSKTTALLHSQRQMIKLKMYKNLFRIIFLSLLVLVLGIIVSSFIFIGMSTTELIEQHWKSRFFFLDFWPSLVYFVIFNLIAFIWRPTDTSYMLAASQQLPTDPENAADFELDDIQSLQNDDDDLINGPPGYSNLNDNDSLNLGSDDENENENNNSQSQGGSHTKKSLSFDDERTMLNEQASTLKNKDI